MARTYRVIAECHGVGVDVIKKLAASGVNVYDNAAVIAANSKKQKRVPAGGAPTISGAGGCTTSEMRDDVVNAEDLDTAKLIKEKASTLKILGAVDREDGLVISIREVDERDTRIGAATKAALDKLGHELPGACAGLDEVGILEVYEGLKRDILISLADLRSDFWRGRPRPDADKTKK